MVITLASYWSDQRKDFQSCVKTPALLVQGGLVWAFLSRFWRDGRAFRFNLFKTHHHIPKGLKRIFTSIPNADFKNKKHRSRIKDVSKSLQFTFWEMLKALGLGKKKSRSSFVSEI